MTHTKQRANAAAPEILEMLLEVVRYETFDSDDYRVLDSCKIKTYADALRLLARFGRVEIEYDKGKRVIARVKE